MVLSILFPVIATLLHCADPATADGGDDKLSGIAPSSALRIESRTPGDITVETKAESSVLTIQGNGIGRATITRGDGSWPEILTLRVKFRGLESLTIANGRVEWKASVLSHGKHQTSIHLWKDGKEGPALEKGSAYWTRISRLNADGRSAEGLPADGGWFEIRVPEVLLSGTRELKFDWIDFHR